MLEALAAWGLPVEPHWTRCDGIDAVVAFCDDWREQAPDARVRDRRRRRQGGRPGAARAARHHLEVSALGHRVQVPGAAGDDACCSGFAVNVGRTGAVTPYRRARAGRRSPAPPSRWPRCTTRTTSRARTSATATASLIEKGGDVIPKVVRAGASPSARPATPWEMPTDCPACGSALAAAGRRGGLALREHLVPGASARGASSTSRRAAR